MNWLKENWFKLGLLSVALLVVFLVTYYYLVFLSQEEQARVGQKISLEPSAVNGSTIAKSEDEQFTSRDLAPYVSGVAIMYCSGSSSTSSGSGSLWKLDDSDNLFVVTNAHVIEGQDSCVAVSFSNEMERQGTYVLSRSPKRWNLESDIAVLEVVDRYSESEAPLESLNTSISSLSFCSEKMAQNTPIRVIGFPVFGEGTAAAPNRIVTEGIVSGYRKLYPANLPYDNYFTSAAIDEGNSGGIALSKYNGKVCVLGIPTWVSVGVYETQGIIQNIHNVFYEE